MVSTGLKNHAPDSTESLHSWISRYQLHHHEICEYAMSAYDAIEHSKEDVPELQVHPHFVDYCRNNSEIDNISRLMAAGIPMGH